MRRYREVDRLFFRLIKAKLQREGLTDEGFDK